MNKGLKNVLTTSLYFLIILLLIFGIITYVGQRIEVIGSSMSPTLENGDGLFVDKISYRFHEPQRFEIVVFPYKYEENTFYIKRIIGLPGETVYIDDDGKIYIDDVLLEEYYGKEVIKDPGRAYEPIKLGPDEYFVIGDNRNNSMDSRDPNVGNIRKTQITGKAFMRVFPFNKIGMIKHK